MKEGRISNYEQNCIDWRKRFLAMDHARLQALLPELRREGEELCLRHFGREYRVSCRTGRIRESRSGREPGHTLQLNIYTLFGFVQPGAKLLGEWVNFAGLRGTAPFDPAYRKSVLRPLAETFSGHLPELERAAEALGALKLGYGDLSFQLDAFACMPLRFLFWEGDEEFPAQANILFDRSATDFIHPESTVTVAAAGLYALAEAAQLPVLGRGFSME